MVFAPSLSQGQDTKVKTNKDRDSTKVKRDRDSDTTKVKTHREEDTAKVKTKRVRDTSLNKGNPGDSLLYKLEVFTKKDNFWARIAKQIFIFEHEVATPDAYESGDTVKVASNIFSPYEGRPIRNIHINSLPPFGYANEYEACLPKNFFEKAGNKLHYRTREWVIYNKLLFTERDKLDPFALSESERLLRNSPAIIDAKIRVVPARRAGDSVDIYITTHDAWAITGNGGVDLPNKGGSLNLTHLNVLGLNHRFDGTLRYRSTLPGDKWEGGGAYTVAEALNSYVTTSVYGYQLASGNYGGLRMDRPFYSPIARVAGGVLLEYRENYVFPPDTFIANPENNFNDDNLQALNTYDLWSGYAFIPKNDERGRSRFILASRLQHWQQSYSPTWADKFPTLFQNRTLLLTSIGWSYRDYYKDHFIFRFGRTEDIPIGMNIALVGGREFRAYSGQRTYTGMKVGWGAHTNLGYLRLTGDIGGLLDGFAVDQSVMKGSLLYFTDVLPWGKWQLRQYVQSSYTRGFGKELGQTLSLEGVNGGLRGLSTGALRGTEKFVANLELDAYSPFKPLGFLLVGIAFADFALVGGDVNGTGVTYRNLWKSRLYQGYGLGVRFRNEHLAVPTLQVTFNIYPGAQSLGATPYSFYQTGQTYYRFTDFGLGAPAEVIF